MYVIVIYDVCSRCAEKKKGWVDNFITLSNSYHEIFGLADLP